MTASVRRRRPGCATCVARPNSSGDRTTMKKRCAPAWPNIAPRPSRSSRSTNSAGWCAASTAWHRSTMWRPRSTPYLTAGLVALQRNEAERGSPVFAVVVIAPDLAPVRRMARIGPACVPGNVLEHLCELDAIGDRQKQGEYVGAADDRDRLGSGKLQGV